jgi:hypothetical protein
MDLRDRARYCVLECGGLTPLFAGVTSSEILASHPVILSKYLFAANIYINGDL